MTLYAQLDTRPTRWTPGSEYTKVTVRAIDRPAVDGALLRHGIGVDHWRRLIHTEQRPPANLELDTYMFCHWIEPGRPPGAPDIIETALAAFRSIGVRAMAADKCTRSVPDRQVSLGPWNPETHS
jgi:hypothetical protein